MKNLRLVFALILVLCAASFVHSQTLEADHQVQGTIDSSVGIIGLLTVVGPASGVTFTTDTVNGNPQQVLNIQASNTMPSFDESGRSNENESVSQCEQLFGCPAR